MVSGMKDKKIIFWVIKLIILTIAIYWFMSDGFQTDVGTSIIQETGSIQESKIFWILAVIVIVYFIFVILRGFYNRNTNKPKDKFYKQYRELK